MRHQIVSVRCVAGSGRLIAPLFIPMILLALGMVFLPGLAFGDVGAPTAGPTWGIDDMNTATLNPTPPIAVSTIGGPNPGQCVWINTGLDAFVAGHAGWSYSWAGPAAEAAVEAGISVLDYKAFVVSEPTDITSANGVTWPADADFQNSPTGNVNDVGGAIFNLKYTPGAPGAHVFTDLHWVQGLRAHYDTYAPGEYQVRLDNPGSPNSPFYDAHNAAGTLPGGGGWFLDTPYKFESEAAESNPTADVQFQVVLADFDSDAKAIVLYGGLWWGYTATASDVRVPEPSTLVLLVFGGIGLLAFGRRKMRAPAR